jgi:hypothetical protein
MHRSDQIAWLLFLVVLGSAAVFLVIASSVAILD